MSKGLRLMTVNKRVLLAMSFALALAIGGSSGAAPEEGEEQGVGQICLAPLAQGFEVPALVEEEETEAPSEAVVLVDDESEGIDNTAVALPDRKVTVEVETRGEIEASRTRAQSLGPIPTRERSLITLREEGKIVQSFLYQRTPGVSEDYCLVYRAGRETWAILPLQDVGGWCSCDHRAYVAPVVPEEKQEGE